MTIGDRVRVIGYGNMTWFGGSCANCPQGEWRDSQPEIVGKEGVIDGIETAHGLPVYSLSGIPEKKQWYSENQIQLV